MRRRALHSLLRAMRRMAILVVLLAVVLVVLFTRLGPKQSGFWDFGPPTPSPADVRQPSHPAPPERLVGRVRYVFDGDTVSLVTNDRRWRIRLVGIDAPEHDQRYGRQARQFLVSLCDQQQVEIRIRGRDAYERFLGDVYVAGEWINGRMVEAGYAWHRSRGEQAARLDALQQDARRAGRGLWADSHPVAPWEHRSRQHETSSVQARP